MVCDGEPSDSLGQRCNGALDTLNGSLFRDYASVLNAPEPSSARKNPFDQLTRQGETFAKLAQIRGIVAGAAAVCGNFPGWSDRLHWVNTDQGYTPALR
ncbi:MAG: hypothetical protein M3O22_01580 [Pseudomonadota bacterium]|nr:hypothetical protein [Pseudomonadota bacterium]